jgi:hypothetical protein
MICFALTIRLPAMFPAIMPIIFAKYLNSFHGVDVPLVLMNSFNTHEQTGYHSCYISRVLTRSTCSRLSSIYCSHHPLNSPKISESDSKI